MRDYIKICNSYEHKLSASNSGYVKCQFHNNILLEILNCNEYHIALNWADVFHQELKYVQSFTHLTSLEIFHIHHGC